MNPSEDRIGGRSALSGRGFELLRAIWQVVVGAISEVSVAVPQQSDLEINELFNAGSYEGYSVVRLWEHDINSGVAFPILLQTIREMESKFAV